MVDPVAVQMAEVEANIVRCPDPAMAEQMIAYIEAVRKEGNSVGGVVGAVARGVPARLGEPVFDKLEADLAKAVMSLPACKGSKSARDSAGQSSPASNTTTPIAPKPARSSR